MQEYNIPYTTGKNGVYYHHEIAVQQNLNEGVRQHNPMIGDIVFFDNTTGSNKPLSHEGIVITAGYDDDQTVVFIDASNSGVGIKYLNTVYPSVNILNGKRINTALAKSPCTQCYAGELFAGYATIDNVVQNK
jgi:hypothetical protein